MTGNISKSKGFRGDNGKDGHTPALELILDENGNLYYSSDGIMVDKEYINSKDLATKEYIAEKLLEWSNKVAPTYASVTLYANRWQQGENETTWYQEVVVANGTITPRSKVDLQPSAEQLAIFHEKDLAFVTENEDGVVTVFCIGQKPANDYVIQATITEVEIDE